MIVFKAECGHTVRAKDEEAGGVVRCSYCGRNASVPDAADGGLDYLLSEIEQSAGAAPAQRRRKSLFSRRRVAALPKKERRFDPFGLVLRLCYFTLLLIIVIVVSRKFVLPLFDSEQRARRLIAADSTPSSQDIKPDADSGVKRQGRGLVTEGSLAGIYVSSVPSGADAFIIEEAKAPPSGGCRRVSGARSMRTNGVLSGLPDGTYLVEVAFTWNDPVLSDPNLPHYKEFLEFRRSIERVSDSERKRRMEEYFLPDEAAEVFATATEERIYFVRQFRGVVIRQGRSPGVRALFLPKLGRREGMSFSLEALTAGYLPRAKSYVFDETHVRSELEYYRVPPSDQRFMVDLLSRIGTVPFVMPEGGVRLFKIDIHDGALTTRVIREGGG